MTYKDDFGKLCKDYQIDVDKKGYDKLEALDVDDYFKPLIIQVKEFAAKADWDTILTVGELKIYAKKSIKTKPEDYEDKIQILWDDDLQTFEGEDQEWIVDKLIPSRSVCILTGKRGTLKTFITLLMSYSISSGKDFLGKFPVEQGKVIYLDKENGIPIMKKRVKMIKKGMGIDKKQDVGFICFSQLKIDKTTDLVKLNSLILSHKPKILIIDTYRRGISFDENDAGAVSELFVDMLRPLVERCNVSIVLIHHNRKGGGDSPDEMDELRGSSDLANYADIILKMERKAGVVILKQLKNRNAQEIEPIKIKVEFDEDSCVKMNYEGVYQKQNKADKCVELILAWFARDNIHHFSTGQAKQICIKGGYKDSAIKNALNEMQDIGAIEKKDFGTYTVL